MDYIVTARKWRPQLFEEVVGQSHITQTLKNAIKTNRVAHAFIFTGPRGVGKTTTARILAKSLNCMQPVESEPCNKCTMCNSFNTSQSLDVIEIDGASNRRIEDIRTLRESVKYSPTAGKYKIYIIDEVHMLTNESFNALLKTLEEPPEHTIFIFATTDIHKVPMTIISRCQRFDFRRIEMDNIKELLSKIATAENIKIDDASLSFIAKKADGALRDAESLFDQVIAFCGKDVEISKLRDMLNFIDDEVYFNISDAILNKNFIKAFEIPATIYQNGWNYIDFVNGLNEHFRNILSVVISKANTMIESSSQTKEKYLKYIDTFSEGDLIRILYFTNNLTNEIKISSTPKLKVEIALSQLIGFEKSDTISKIIEKIQNIPDNYQITKDSTEESEKKKSEPLSLTTNKIISDKKSVNDDNYLEIWTSFISDFVNKNNWAKVFHNLTKLYFSNNKIIIEFDKLEDYQLVNNNRSDFISTFNDKLASYIDFEFELKQKLLLEKDFEEIEQIEEEKSELEKDIINILNGKKI